MYLVRLRGPPKAVKKDQNPKPRVRISWEPETMPTKQSRMKRGLQKLQPKWKNEAAGKSLYLFGTGALTMSLSLLAPFWYSTSLCP